MDLLVNALIHLQLPTVNLSEFSVQFKYKNARDREVDRGKPPRNAIDPIRNYYLPSACNDSVHDLLCIPRCGELRRNYFLGDARECHNSTLPKSDV
mgnify:CR=1 FL=1